MQAIDVANDFFAAVKAGDVTQLALLYHDDLVVWQSCSDAVMDKATTLEQVRLLSALGGIEHRIEEQYGEGDRCFQRCHVVIDGGPSDPIEFRSGMSITISDGKILKIHEYVDRSVAEAIGRALGARMAS